MNIKSIRPIVINVTAGIIVDFLPNLSDRKPASMVVKNWGI